MKKKLVMFDSSCLVFILVISGVSTGLCYPWQPSTTTSRTPQTHQSTRSPCSTTSLECLSWHCLSVRLVGEWECSSTGCCEDVCGSS